MTSPERSVKLPKVERDDIFDVEIQEVIDPENTLRWREFAAANPVLAQEILLRASRTVAAIREHCPRTADFEKLVIDTVSFAISALETALRRSNSDSHAATMDQASVDGGGEDPQLSV